MLSLDITTEADQEALGGLIAAVLPTAGCVVFLHGDLGAGKTTLVRGILRGLGFAGTVKSPTYTLIEPYELLERTVLHLDLYRVLDPGELEYLGLDDFAIPGTLWFIEWPERGDGWLPAADVCVNITHKSTGRNLSLVALSDTGTATLHKLQTQLGPVILTEK